MTLSNQLADHVFGRRQAQSLTDTLFEEDISEETARLAQVMVPQLIGLMEAHINSLPIAPVNKPIVVDILPDNMPLTVAMLLDEQCPDWNIAQKTCIYIGYLEELRKAGQKSYMQRVRDVHTEEARKKGAHAKPVEGSEDPGEFDIKEPRQPGLN